MTTRRDLVLLGACAAAAGSAFALTPRNRKKLLTGERLSAYVPTTVGAWVGEDVDDLIKPEEGTLAATLYSENVGRVYVDRHTGDGIMMLLAYGDTQSDRLQLHRPEVCYPAFGFRILENRVGRVALNDRAALPVRRLVASAPERLENVTYWSRLGEFLPTDGDAQRVAKLKTSMRGDIADGLLARFSMVGVDSARQFDVTSRFIRDLLAHVPPKGLPAMVGTELARAVS